MPALYVTRQGARLRIHKGRLRVEFDDDPADDIDPEELLDVPLGHVDHVVLFGNIGLTTPAIGELLERGIDVVFLSEDGGYRGRLSGKLTPHVPLRRAQYRRTGDPDFVLALARAFVTAKIDHQRALLARHLPEVSPETAEGVLTRLKAARQAVERKTTLPALRGLEGSASAAYFAGFRSLFSSAWKFERRQRRPPPDPVNVLLSFGYTLLFELALGAVHAAGLDPYAGFLHEVSYNRPAITLDLMEEFRPVVDGVVLWACRSGQLTPAHFTPGPAERPVSLSPNGRRSFIRAFENRMDQLFTHPVRKQRFPMRQCICEQARQLAGSILAGNPAYQGMGFR